MKRFYIFLFGIATVNQFYAQTDSLPKPIENVFDVVWMDTIRLKNTNAEPIINGKLIIPSYGSDGCYLAETGEKLFYTFSPHQRKIKNNMESRYVLLKTDGSNIIFDIITGKHAYYKLYDESLERFRNPNLPINKVVNNRYICFASSSNTLTCVDTATMKEKWIFEAESKLFDNYIENKQTVFIGSEKYIYAIDLLTGKLKWKTEVGLVKANLILKENLLFAFIEAKGIIAININNGNNVFSTNRISLFLNTKKLLCDENILYFADYKLHAVNTEKGEYIYETHDYSSCTNTESFFIYNDYLFSQSCARGNYFLEGFDRFTGKKIFKASDNIANKEVKDFLINATYFSPTYKNMIFTTSMADLKDGFWVAKIYGVKIKTEDNDDE